MTMRDEKREREKKFRVYTERQFTYSKRKKNYEFHPNL